MPNSKSQSPGPSLLATDKQIIANQLNAEKSTGPRTKAGKGRVSKNAVKHGLASAVATDEETNAIAERLSADLFAGQDCSVIARERALEIAEIQSALIRIRAAKTELLQDASDIPSLSETLDQYRRFDRYERRALSRRKTLLREMV